MVPVSIGVGVSFEFVAGVVARAPRWMQRSGLEWFYRLCAEPGRLWKRYLFGNVRFCMLIAGQSGRFRTEKLLSATKRQ
jgi:N-acetylglucosaminyldiphosphoundecaprenol N-acetyl-beta-D-mannosaminyltransferase